MDEMALRQRVCEVARQLWQRGLMVADEGLISVEVHRRRFLVTPPGVRRADLSARSLLVTDLAGSAMAQQGLIPCERWLAHRIAYEVRGDGTKREGDGGVVRATILSRPPMICALARRLSGGGSIDLGELQLPRAGADDAPTLREHLQRGDAVGLGSCGVMVVGAGLDQALNLLERLELAATIELAVWRGE